MRGGLWTSRSQCGAMRVSWICLEYLCGTERISPGLIRVAVKADVHPPEVESSLDTWIINQKKKKNI